MKPFSDLYGHTIYSEEMQQSTQTAMSLLEVDVHEALGVLNGCLKDAAECMKKYNSISKNMRHSDWYDNACCVSKRNVRKLLKKCRRSLSIFDRDYTCIRLGVNIRTF